MWDPLECLSRDPPSRSEYKEYVLTKITAYYEEELRIAAGSNSCMKYLNVNMIGLRGKHHPAIANIKTIQEVAKMRPHLKMLCGNLLTYGTKFEQDGLGSPHCRLCGSEFESVSHVVATCCQFNEIRMKILSEYDDLLKTSKNNLRISIFMQSENKLAQFLLDPTSMNLEERIHLNDPIVTEAYKLSRDICSAISKQRMNKLNEMQEKKKKC